MNKEELIEGISFPVKHLEVYLNKAYSVDIMGNGDCEEFGILDVYDGEEQCNHSKTIYTESDIYEGDTEDNMITCVDYMRYSEIIKSGIEYELYFGDDENDKPITLGISSKGDIIY